MIKCSFPLVGLVAAAVLLSGCSTSEPSPTATTSTTPAVTIGEVPGQPAAAQSVRAWATDLVAGNLDVLVRKCWTIAPSRVRSMYGDVAAIESATRQPGIDGQFAYIWQDDNTSVSVKRSEVASGYACPYVAPRSDVHIFNSDDAKYRVLRYVLRVVGQPINPDDAEAKYPLECRGTMSDTSRSIAATTIAVDRDSFVASGGPDDWEVTVRGTSNGGESRDYRYRTTVGPEGYCVAEIR